MNMVTYLSIMYKACNFSVFVSDTKESKHMLCIVPNIDCHLMIAISVV